MDPKDYEKLLRETTVHFARSSGKGGQNVNKVETKAQLTFNVQNSPILTEYEKCLITCKLKNSIDHEGNLHVTASSERYQHANRVKAEQKFIHLIKNALKEPKRRIKTAPTASSRFARLVSKQKQSLKKEERKKRFLD